MNNGSSQNLVFHNHQNQPHDAETMPPDQLGLLNGRDMDGQMFSGVPTMENEGLHSRRQSSTAPPSSHHFTMDKQSSAAAATLKFAGAKDAFSTYDVLWCRTKNWIQAMKHVPWKNNRALPGRAYTPTEVEHVANVVTHGLWIVPAIFAGLQLLWRSNSNNQKITAIVYGSALTLLFAVSTIFHIVHYINKNRSLKDLLHRCDRAMIYIFIAGSYYPWLSLAPPAHPTILFITNTMVWLLAGLGIIYQQVYHERYKCLETCLYLVMGIGPSLILILNGHHFKGMDELELGGVMYIVGILFFKADGKVPFAHAIWHLFVVVAAFIHYYAILKYLY